MNPEQVLARYMNDPGVAALNLVRRFRGTDLEREASERWCRRFGGSVHTFAENLDEPYSPARMVHQLLGTTVAELPVLEDWHRLAVEGGRYRYHVDDTATDGALLSLIVAVLPDSEKLDRLPTRLGAWAAAVGRDDAAHVAHRLRKFPDLLPALLGPVWFRPGRHPCEGCQSDARCPFDTGYFHVGVALARRRAQLPENPFDDVIQMVPTEAWFDDAVLLGRLVEALQAGMKPPPRLWSAIDDALENPDHKWAAIGYLLSGESEDHERGVSAMRQAIETADEPESLFQRLWGDETSALCAPPVFSGRGWGRGRRPRKLKPIAREFLRRGVWPSQGWFAQLYIRPDRDQGKTVTEATEQAWEAVREILAEALLSFLLDKNEQLVHRTRALSAFERLSPRGNNSQIEALGKVQDPAGIKQEARRVRRALSHQRERVTDAELAIEDALAIYLE